MTEIKNIQYKEMVYGSELKEEILAEGTCYNFKFYIISYGTHPCSYIEIPKNNKLYGKTYFEKIYDSLNVHGGITYSKSYLRNIIKDSWVIGWDYAHLGDYCGICEKNAPKINENTHKYTTEELLNDVVEVAKQLKGAKYRKLWK